MKRSLTTLCLLFAALSATLAQKKEEPIQTEHGYLFTNHTKKEGARLVATNWATIQVKTWIGDSLMASTYDMGGARDIQVPKPDAMPKRIPPVYDALLLMAKGDSATILQTIDSLLRPHVPERLRAEKYLRFDIELLDIQTDEAHNEAFLKERAMMDARLAEVEKQTQQLAEDFKNGKLKGKLQETASGLKYIVHDQGSGARIQKGDNIRVHYYGCLSDGKKFDDSFTRNEALPFTAGEGQMISGFDEGALLLRHGAKATLFLPYKLAYGEEGAGDVIPPKSDLIFYIEIQ
ncbi:MAG: FKBP-type peptidyl-prolyl cis-trans isomerase [Saprospiraceae bacterium]|nr:FKBP-type peptidyl-prolyl cis-trans isomerase [Saprospiraceae bacterium]HNL39188.1 FKBP-type peptidyl-prolyl cis-trans isomerase [Saprospiraceae bacterium]